MQKLLDEIRSPLDASIEFALKYHDEHERLRAALPHWEAAAAAMSRYREASRRQGDAEQLQDLRQQCLDAADALLAACGDVAKFEGVEFVQLLAASA